ncbi:hypothetical protein J2S43_008156 [Catenuloplanes nepalensis]|uniref:Uncharacterized protein n=1 Tax=Catenuloplanes nepalensis TaxID=587533 RepID=A0ABT9N7G2_9ACTN|nr:hypothetical protein [Catenuloplanes nepalensis]MDP9799644.1 hypothetical protein [Catenuloplanes nepalensis]
MTEQHIWRTVSTHHTSTGPVRYERCHCGAWRMHSGSGRAWITSSRETARVGTA